MKHVIAGQTDKDVIEWRLVLDEDGEPALEARKGDEYWRCVFSVCDDEAVVFKNSSETIGLKAEVY